MNIGRLHFLFIHFPIVLFVAAAIGQILWSITHAKPRKDLDRCVQWLVYAGTAGAVIAAVLGWILHQGMTLTLTLERHRNLGIAAAVAAVGFLLLMRSDADYRLKLTCLVLLAALTGVAAHFGGVSVHGAPFGR